MTKAYIVTPLRSAVGKAFRGGLRTKRPDDLCADLIRAVLAKTPAFDPHEIDDCIVGCAMPEGEQGMNIGRFAALLAGLPESVPGVTVNRFCSSGLKHNCNGCTANSSWRSTLYFSWWYRINVNGSYDG